MKPRTKLLIALTLVVAAITVGAGNAAAQDSCTISGVDAEGEAFSSGISVPEFVQQYLEGQYEDEDSSVTISC